MNRRVVLSCNSAKITPAKTLPALLEIRHRIALVTGNGVDNCKSLEVYLCPLQRLQQVLKMRKSRNCWRGPVHNMPHAKYMLVEFDTYYRTETCEAIGLDAEIECKLRCFASAHDEGVAL